MDNENMNTNEVEVIEAADQIVEEIDGLDGKVAAFLGGAGVGLVAAVGYYGIKKVKAAIKRHNLVKQAKQEIEDDDSFEEFEDGDEEEEIHVVK